jgi:acetolactate synthase I/II/III large subunit
MMKLSDYVFRYLADYGVRHVFVVTGGGAMHLNDSLGKEKRLEYICNHHEQACTIAAEGYARVTSGIGVANVTSGPGGVNALNGVYGAWTDSIPMLVISGQIKRQTCLATYGIPGLRQLGDQEADIISMAKVITKYAVLVDDPQRVRYHLERALHLATTGRPGPCWLDIPLDVQASIIDETTLAPYDPAEDDPEWDRQLLAEQCREVISRLATAARPVLLAGSGIRQAGAIEAFEELLRRLQIPVVLSRTAKDLLPADHQCLCGRGGIDADRCGNFTTQGSDLLISLGCRLGVRQTGYNFAGYAPDAFKVQVEIDPAELTKPTTRGDLQIQVDAKLFIEEMLRQLDANGDPPTCHHEWRTWCKQRLARYPAVRPEQCSTEGPINPYFFLKQLFEQLDDDDIIVCANGAAFIMACQVAQLKRGQRVLFNSGCASMGYDLPAALGAAIACRNAEAGRSGRVICLAGDGSIQMNIQELQTIAQQQLPIKIFVLNNCGYLSIRTTQRAFFGNCVGESPASGMTCPDLVRVADAYGLATLRIAEHGFAPTIRQGLDTPGPVLYDVIVDPEQTFEPRCSSKQLPDGTIVSAPLEDMYPFLERDELAANMPSADQTAP